MECFETVAALRHYVAEARRNGARIGLVPTMGYLHAGHLSLVQAARRDCQIVVMSIFINPRQFGPREDFSTYPRDLERDRHLATGAGVDAVFTPPVEEVYPPHFQTEVVVHQLAMPLCGASRPGHFTGVTTVVSKLFNMVQPDCAYFGQKDYQQVTVIRQMVRDLNMPLEVVTCPTVREADGLAMSSRNVRLNPAERQAALIVPRTLHYAAQCLATGERAGAHLAQALRTFLATEPLARVDYAEVCDPATLQPCDRLQGTVLIALAVFIGTTRLIDNAVLDVETGEAQLVG